MVQEDLIDVQNRKDSRGIDIQKVGVKNVEVPLNILRKNDKAQVVSAKATMSVGLPGTYKGTHMSRFVEILCEWSQKKLLGDDIELFLEDTTEKLNAKSAEVKFVFTYFIPKTSPISRLTSYMGYECSFEGILVDDYYRFILGVSVPVTTLCPCSKEISEYGAHNQRTIIKVKVSYDADKIIWIEDLIDIMENCGSSRVYPLLKREDEKYVTEYAYNNPKFVEDVLREAISKIKNINEVNWFEIDCESFESIHNHSAWAYQQEYTD